MLSDIFSPNKRYLLKRVTICGMLLLAAVIVLRRCDRAKVKEIESEQLKPGERTAIIVGPDSVTTVVTKAGFAAGNGIRAALLRGRVSKPSTPDGQTVDRIDGARGIRISISDKGNVTVTARTKGFCFEPGVGLYTTASDRRISLDVQFLFARRHGVNAGVGLGLGKPFTGTAFIAYSYNFYSNTSGFIGYDTRGQVLVGARVKF